MSLPKKPRSGSLDSPTENLRECTICSGNFDLEKEGGTEGSIGILPVAFCPTCRTGIIDFVEQQCPRCQGIEDDY